MWLEVGSKKRGPSRDFISGGGGLKIFRKSAMQLVAISATRLLRGFGGVLPRPPLKFINPTEKSSTPPEKISIPSEKSPPLPKNLNASRKSLNPPEKIPTPPEKISTPLKFLPPPPP